MPMDVTDFAAIDRLGETLAQRYGKLDILVGNAGTLGVLSPVGHIDPAVWHHSLNVNLNANWRLITVCDPLLRQSEAGRLVFTTFNRGFKALPYWSAYACGKAALEMLVKTYAREVAKTPIRANLMDPGDVATQLRREALPGGDFSKTVHPRRRGPRLCQGRPS